MNIAIRFSRIVGFALMVGWMVTACSPESDIDSDPDGTVALDNGAAAASMATSACEQLLDSQLAGVTVNEAVALEVSERQADPTAGPVPQTVRSEVMHCKVTGVIDSTINFELLMPDDWNGKFLMGGGGGFVGSVENQAQEGLGGGSTPLERGYATAGTDTGHTGDLIDASWALNDPTAQENFAHLAVHRTAEVSKSIIASFYAAGIDYSYFLGCSRGGGQALISAQRYPEDFDGIIAGAPVLDWPGTTSGFIRNQQSVFPDPNNLSSPVITMENRNLLAETLRNTCDAIDGVADGFMNDPRTCPFDPAELPRCEGEPGPGCVTESQLEAIQTIYSGPNVNGEQVHPGFPFGGESDAAGWDLWITQAEPPNLPVGTPNLHYAFGTQFFKYFIHSDPDWTYAGYTFPNWREQSEPVAALLNATDSNLTNLRDKGGKVILWHGWSDAALTALGSIEYYESVEQQDLSAHEYFRMFLMPGVGHCGGGPGPDNVDWITAIEQWVEDNVAPERQIASKVDEQGTIIMERPLCPYPESAIYDGSGDPNVATSFSCAAPTN
jgi:feruloyl esterase